MMATLSRRLTLSLSMFLMLSCCAVNRVCAARWDPAAADYSGHKGKTIYVSKLGDNSDGSSWRKAFHTIQAALLAVPDDQGGHQIIVRPDTYAEANLYPTFKGAQGAYNLLVGDADGKLGSGATGWVVIDSSCPGVAVRTDSRGPEGIPCSRSSSPICPESGLKCVDWWGPFGASPTIPAWFGIAGCSATCTSTG